MLDQIPASVSTLLLGVLTFVGTWFATWMLRRGKKEDVRLASRDQAYDEMRELAAERKTEIDRLTAALAAQTLETERTRTTWEGRWDRQMARCRVATASLVGAIDALRIEGAKPTPPIVDASLRELMEHNEGDHDIS